MIKLCIGKYAIFLLDRKSYESIKSLDFKRAIIYKSEQTSKLVSLIYNIDTQEIKNHVFIFKNPKSILKELKMEFNSVIAGGGLVINEKNEILFIYRNSKWDLPKGKAEKNESKKETAIRETEEECGIKIDECGDLIMTTYHFYERSNRLNLKTTYWYEMKSSSKYKLAPQIEENIEKVEWVKKKNIPSLLENSYRSIQDILESYYKI